MYNKVITSQYFLWYLTLAPLALINNDLTGLKWKRGICLAIGFLVFELIWLWPAYLFEFLGQQRFKEIQLCNYLWFLYTLVMLQQVIANSRLTVTRSESVSNEIKKDKKD